VPKLPMDVRGDAHGYLPGVNGSLGCLGSIIPWLEVKTKLHTSNL
jgi:hypothetical protein